MEELIAKRYVKALKSDTDIASLEAISEVFAGLADSFKDDKFINVVTNPNVAVAEKATLLLDAVKKAESDKLNNFIQLLVENKRIQIIPAISKELKKDIAVSTKTFEGKIYSDSDMDAAVVTSLAEGLSKKFDSTITLTFIKNDFNGIKVEVEGLGVEINFSKDRIDSQFIQHIIKAI